MLGSLTMKVKVTRNALPLVSSNRAYACRVNLISIKNSRSRAFDCPFIIIIIIIIV